MVAKSRIIDSPDIETQQPKDIPGNFDTVYVPEAPEIEVVSGSTRGVKGKGGLSKEAEELLFNEEMIDVMLHESTDPNAENPVFTSCNGVPQYFFRGQVQTVRRKYVAILAAVKEHAISTPEYTQADGARATKIQRTSSLKYPFSIISDKNPRGAAWLRSLIQAPT